ncbi:MAG: flagellar motor protein MotB [Candidatus Omnitrophota bacterium]
MQAKLMIIMILMVSMLSGCAYIQKARRADELEIENASLRNMAAQLQKEKTKEVRQVYQEKDKELSDLEQAKRELEESLKKEIGEYKAKLQMTERGLVITFVSEIFFDSGKDKVKKDGKITLNKVAEVLNRDVPGSNIAIEGHTDNDPIKYSGWNSNWELSSARALAVLHDLIGEGKIKPQRLSANGYGEFHPVAPNDIVRNKQKNRRVEIVILPSKLSKVKSQ